MQSIKALTIVTIICTLAVLYADDAAMYAEGSSIFAIQQNQISLNKQILKIVERKSNKKIEDEWYVSVYFEFLNPDTNMTIDLGFITPQSDIPDLFPNKVGIDSFSVVVNNELLEYKIDLVKNLHIDKIGEEKENWEDKLIFRFKANFKRGINIIEHNYICYGGSLVGGGSYFTYDLKTGALWAGSKIKNFELYLQPYDNTLVDFFDNDSTAKGIVPNIVIKGIGTKLSNDRIYIHSGGLCFKKKNYIPNENINILAYANWDGILELMKQGHNVDIDNFRDCLLFLLKYDISSLRKNKGFYFDKLRGYNKDRLLVFQNLPLAINSFKFKNKAVYDFYSQFKWYYPDIKVKKMDVLLDERNRLYYDMFEKLKR